MHMVGLFDRPASGDCLRALRQAPAIDGLTDAVVDLDEGAWQRAVARLREVRLLAPPDPAAPDALDAHPLVREWFGERLKADERSGMEGRPRPALRAPARHDQGRQDADARRPRAALPGHRPRLPRRPPPGGARRDLQRPHLPAAARRRDRILCQQEAWRPRQRPRGDLLVLRRALRDAGRHADAGGPGLGARRGCLRPCAHRGGLPRRCRPSARRLRMDEDAKDWSNAAISASNLSEAELLVGEVAAAVATARTIRRLCRPQWR